MMSGQVVNVRLVRVDSSTQWGFRMEGGVDTGRPVSIQRVAPRSVAEHSGLMSGDYVLRINRSDTGWMRHEDAKMEIVRSSNDIEMVIQRGGTRSAGATIVSAGAAPVTLAHAGDHHSNRTDVWRPKVVSSVQMAPASRPAASPPHPHNAYQGAGPPANISLAASLRPDMPSDIGVSHNTSPLPFGQEAPMPGAGVVGQGFDGRVRRIGHSAYNSPLGLYNRQQVDNTYRNTVSAAMTSPTGNPGGGGGGGGGGQSMQQGLMRCGACGDSVKGVFVKVQGRVPMHPACLKCCKCGVGLRNVGYFYIDEKLYCETHAKQAAPPPEPGMKPVVVYK